MNDIESRYLPEYINLKKSWLWVFASLWQILVYRGAGQGYETVEICDNIVSQL